MDVDNLIQNQGKILPSDISAEESVIGALIIESDSYYKIDAILSEQMFYKDEFALVYKAIKQLHDKDSSVDLVTVNSQLTNNNDIAVIGGAYFLMEITSKVASSAHIEQHANIIKEKYIQREFIRRGVKISQLAYDDITKADDEINRLSNFIDNEFGGSIEENKETAIDEAKRLIEQANAGVINGLSTGNNDIDKLFRLEGGMLHVIAGRPGSGKSSLTLNMIAKTSLDNDKHVLFSSLEMPNRQIIQWLLMGNKTPERTAKYGKFYDDDRDIYNNALKQIDEYNLYFSEAQNLHTLISRAKYLKRKNQLDLWIIDYMQMVKVKAQNRNLEIDEIMTALKSFAKKNDVPIIILSQLNREVEKRSDKIPQLSDLRDSGSIEEKADVVMFLFRAEYYDTESYYTINGEDIPSEGIGRAIIAKNKNGETGSVYFRYNYNLKEFYPYIEDTSSVFSGMKPSTEFDVNPDRQFEPRKDNPF